LAGSGYFKEKTAVVLGADCALGHRLAIKLAASQARVVLVDRKVDRLDPLVRRFPKQVDTLALSLSLSGTLEQFGSHWDREPLDVLINLFPLTRSADPSAQTRILQGVDQGFSKGLAAGKGVAMTVWRAADCERDGVALHAQDGTLQAGTAALARSLRKAGARGTSLRLAARVDPAEAVQTVLSLCGPAGVGLGPQAVPFLV
jgi:NAD(P)-dependent dehydrogenase (short-subunit alcohol dehydrogenase family)